MSQNPKGKRILIMGLNNSGKTTFSLLLRRKLKCPYFNADEVREQFHDFSFQPSARERQAKRMRILCDWALGHGHRFAIADFICPTATTRAYFDSDYTVFMDTTFVSPYKDTEKLFHPPTLHKRRDHRITSLNNLDEEVEKFVWRILKPE